jgi:MFS family permease
LGVKYTLAFGGIGYSIYAISLLVSVHKSVGGFNIFAGALLGVCAGLLWTAQGTIMISYPSEAEKGRYFAWFWGIFNMGAVIGSLVSALCPGLIFWVLAPTPDWLTSSRFRSARTST